MKQAVAVRTDQSARDSALPWVNAVVIALILLSSFAVIRSSHACRDLYAKLQALESAQWFLQENYGRLLLEKSTWASDYRIEKRVREDLHMRAPDLNHWQVVRP